MPPGPSIRPTRQFTLRYLLLCTAIVAFCLLPVAHCPSFTPDPDIADVTTAYVAILGDHTAWHKLHVS